MQLTHHCGTPGSGTSTTCGGKPSLLLVLLARHGRGLVLLPHTVRVLRPHPVRAGVHGCASVRPHRPRQNHHEEEDKVLKKVLEESKLDYEIN